MFYTKRNSYLDDSYILFEIISKLQDPIKCTVLRLILAIDFDECKSFAQRSESQLPIFIFMLLRHT